MPTRYKLPLESNPEFVALPSDPSVPLTPEQSAALWGGDVNGVLRSILLGAMREQLAQSQNHPTPIAAPVPEKAAVHAS